MVVTISVRVGSYAGPTNAKGASSAPVLTPVTPLNVGRVPCSDQPDQNTGAERTIVAAARYGQMNGVRRRAMDGIEIGQFASIGPPELRDRCGVAVGKKSGIRNAKDARPADVRDGSWRTAIELGASEEPEKAQCARHGSTPSPLPDAPQPLDIAPHDPSKPIYYPTAWLVLLRRDTANQKS
jgi:hypothetical protein